MKVKNVQIPLKYLIRCLVFQPNLFISAAFGYESSVIPLKKILSLLPESAVIVEAGVATGEDTIKFCEAFPTGKVFGLEPVPELFQKASKRLKNYKNVRLENSALVGTESNDVDLYISKEINDASSVLAPSNVLTVHPDITYDHKIRVSATTLDKFCLSQGITDIDILWLDLQGLEYSVLKNGGMRSLSRTAYVHLEVSRIPLYQESPDMAEVVEFMESAGFEPLISRVPFLSGNILFRRVLK